MAILSLNTLKLFFESTSIRGFSRIVRTNSVFLRVLWTVFVVSTTTFLAVYVFKIVVDYREYSVNIQTYLDIDGKSAFPSVSFCNNQPFSQRAYKAWREERVLTPTEFNRNIRDLGYNLLQLEPINTNPAFFFAAGCDRLANYYQQLTHNVAVELGHDVSSIYLCVFRYKGRMVLTEMCQDNMIQLRNFSHPSFFNCFTVEPKLEFAHDITQLALVIWLGPTEDHDIQYRQAFISDIFEQAYGLRVAVHEPGSFADMEQHGIQIEPGKMNQISYQPAKYQRANTIVRPCIEGFEAEKTYVDLNNNYTYEIELCLKVELQNRVYEKCHCIFSIYPRPHFPNDERPYCGKLNGSTIEELNSFFKRAMCVQTVVERAIEIKAELQKTVCVHRCTNWKYENTVSVTKWRNTNWQLHWLRESLTRYQQLDDKLEKNGSYKVEYDRVKEFLLRRNLTSLGNNGSNTPVSTFDNRYAYVYVNRESNNTFVKVEKLVLTLNALFSRIGGLCSLYIGMTLAVVIEFIEFIYLVICGSPSGPEDKKPQSKDDEEDRESEYGQRGMAKKRIHRHDSVAEDNEYYGDEDDDGQVDIPLTKRRSRRDEDEILDRQLDKPRGGRTERNGGDVCNAGGRGGGGDDQVWIPNRGSRKMGVQNISVQ